MSCAKCSSENMYHSPIFGKLVCTDCAAVFDRKKSELSEELVKWFETFISEKHVSEHVNDEEEPEELEV